VALIIVEGSASSFSVELLPDGRVRIDDVLLSAVDLGNGEWRVDTNAGAIRLWADGSPEHPWIYADGVVYRPAIGSGRTQRHQHDDLASLSAPMPATVRAVLVSPGQTVSRGDTVVILEAMKMELPLRAPHDGVVSAVACQAGELVQPGAPLLEIQ
jgi:acetyl/propionyl-CoA carboxylase alpha subunit